MVYHNVELLILCDTCPAVGGSGNMAEQRSASGSMAAGESDTATATQLPTAAAGVSGDISRTLSELQ